MPDPISDLQAFEIPDQILIEELTPGYPLIHINNAAATATMALHGAHLIHFAPHDEAPVIYTSSDAIYREGIAIRGGIPICWPWFGAHPASEKNLPAHGYARTSLWQLTSTESDKSSTRLRFELPAQADDLLSATLEVTIGRELSIALTSTNGGTEDQLISEALHSYFYVGDCRQCHITGLDGSSYIDTTGSAKTTQQQTGDIAFAGEVDRIYGSHQTVVVVDPVHQRRINIAKTNSGSTIIWNPGQQKGEAMGDLTHDEIYHFVCAESGNVGEQSIFLAAGTSHTLQLQISTHA